MKYELTKTRFKEAVWEGLLEIGRGNKRPPELTVVWRDTALSGVRVTSLDQPNQFSVQISVPDEAIGDGVQTFAIYVDGHDEMLDSFTLIAGEAVGDDLRAEVELLRAELDMLKRAFRRHCNET